MRSAAIWKALLTALLLSALAGCSSGGDDAPPIPDTSQDDPNPDDTPQNGSVNWGEITWGEDNWS